MTPFVASPHFTSRSFSLLLIWVARRRSSDAGSDPLTLPHTFLRLPKSKETDILVAIDLFLFHIIWLSYWKMDDSPTSHVLRNDSVCVDSSPLLPLTDDPPPPPFDYPPKAIESNAALGNEFEKDSFVDEILGNPKSESDAAKLRERGACLDANLIVEWRVVCDDHHRVEQNNADQLPFPALPPDCNSCELLRQIIHSSGME